MDHDFKVTVFGSPPKTLYECKNCLEVFQVKGERVIVTPSVLQDFGIPVECDGFLMEVNYVNYN